MSEQQSNASTNPFVTAERVAPLPNDPDASREEWARHYAATALAAHVAFLAVLKTVPERPEPGSRPTLGHMAAIMTSAAAAACALVTAPEKVARWLWNLTPELGALNGEYIDWLAETLDNFGVNPADIDPAFNPADFRSPRQAGGVA